MSKPLILGIDVGTGSAKGVLVEVGGTFFASATSQYKYATPSVHTAEQDPRDWWHAVCEVCQELMVSTSHVADRLRGVGISGQGVAAVVLDEHYEPVRPAMLWMDTRAAKQAREMESSWGQFISSVSGKRPAAYASEPKLIWMQQHEPELWQRVAFVTTTTGYINLRLVGRSVMNHSDAGVLLCYDLYTRSWSEQVLACLGIQRSLFPSLAESTDIIGTITEAASKECGLPAGIPVVGGGEDTSSAGLAMGVTGEGDVQLSVGTACTVYIPNKTVRPDPRLLTFPYVLPGLMLTGGSMISGGISVEWLMKLFRGREAPREAKSAQLAALTEEAKKLPIGAGGLIFLPYLAGELQPINDGFARGVMLGLTLDTEPSHLLRSIFEGTAFAVRHNLDIAREVGAEAQQILCVGGPSKNELWCQTIASVTGLPLLVMDERTGAALGDAILAALGVGLIADPMEMQRIHARIHRKYFPQIETATTYDEMYSMYRELYPRLRDFFPRLHRLERN